MKLSLQLPDGIMCILISIVVTPHWPLHQLDIKNVFIYDDLNEEVYMQQLSGFVAHGSLVYYVD